MIPFSTVRSVRDKWPKMDSRPDWPSFADFLEEESKIAGVEKNATLCICPAVYEDGVVRAKGRVMCWTWFACDIDNKGENQPGWTMADVAEKCVAQDVPFVIYTTTSHTAQAHRFRLTLPLNRIVEPEEFPEFWASMAAWLGCLDAATKDESRLFVAPRAWPGAEFYRCDEGEPLDVDLIKLLNPVVVAAKPRRSLTSGFADITGLKPVCPSMVGLNGDFVTPDSLAKARGGSQGTRMFPLLVRAGTRALLKGYAITPDDLATIGFEFATSIGRQTDDIEHDATNAYAAALGRYAEIKAANLTTMNKHQQYLAKWGKAK